MMERKISYGFGALKSTQSSQSGKFTPMSDMNENKIATI